MTERRQAEENVQAPPARRGRFWLALVIMLAICGFAIYRSSLFRLGRVEITGLERLTEERVMEVAGLRAGMPRWERSASEIEERLKAEPWVKAVSAQWHLNGVQIEIQERKPVGLLRYYGVYYLALDETGMILEQLDLQGGRGIPVISGISADQALRGEVVESPGLSDALAVVSLMETGLRSQVSEVNVSADRSLMLYMGNGATVLWGGVPAGKDREAEIDRKIKNFGGVWKEVPRRRVASCRIDLRMDDKATASGCE